MVWSNQKQNLNIKTPFLSNQTRETQTNYSGMDRKAIEYLALDRERLKTFTTNWTLSDMETAIGLMLEILQILWLLRGKGVSKTTWPAGQIKQIKMLYFRHRNKNCSDTTPIGD
jgi:hypothetical protein